MNINELIGNGQITKDGTLFLIANPRVFVELIQKKADLALAYAKFMSPTQISQMLSNAYSAQPNYTLLTEIVRVAHDLKNEESAPLDEQAISSRKMVAKIATEMLRLTLPPTSPITSRMIAKQIAFTVTNIELAPNSSTYNHIIQLKINNNSYEIVPRFTTRIENLTQITGQLIEGNGFLNTNEEQLKNHYKKFTKLKTSIENSSKALIIFNTLITKLTMLATPPQYDNEFKLPDGQPSSSSSAPPIDNLYQMLTTLEDYSSLQQMIQSTSAEPTLRKLIDTKRGRSIFATLVDALPASEVALQAMCNKLHELGQGDDEAKMDQRAIIASLSLDTLLALHAKSNKLAWRFYKTAQVGIWGNVMDELHPDFVTKVKQAVDPDLNPSVPEFILPSYFNPDPQLGLTPEVQQQIIATEEVNRNLEEVNRNLQRQVNAAQGGVSLESSMFTAYQPVESGSSNNNNRLITNNQLITTTTLQQIPMNDGETSNTNNRLERL